MAAGRTSVDAPGGLLGLVCDWAEAGATWWIEANWGLADADAVAASLHRLRAGPPRI